MFLPRYASVAKLRLQSAIHVSLHHSTFQRTNIQQPRDSPFVSVSSSLLRGPTYRAHHLPCQQTFFNFFTFFQFLWGSCGKTEVFPWIRTPNREIRIRKSKTTIPDSSHVFIIFEKAYLQHSLFLGSRQPSARPFENDGLR